MESEKFCSICGDVPRASRAVRRAQDRLVRTGRGVAQYVGVLRRGLVGVGRATSKVLVGVGRATSRALRRVLDLVGPTFAFAFLAILGAELLTAVVLHLHGAGVDAIVLIAGGVGIASAEVAVRLASINRGGPGAGAMAPAPA